MPITSSGDTPDELRVRYRPPSSACACTRRSLGMLSLHSARQRKLDNYTARDWYTPD
jgi:hypothetical protein